MALAALWACLWHISHRKIFMLKPGTGGRLMKIRGGAGPTRSNVHTCGLRSRISFFTKQSRWRMMQLIGKLDRGQPAIFVTLTYPDEYAHSDVKRRWRRDLDVYSKRFARRFPGAAAMWKREMKPRKTGLYVGHKFPHIHLLVWGISDYLRLRRWIAFTWWHVCGKLSGAHLAAGTQVDNVKSNRGVLFYVSKYMAKTEDFNEYGWGRWWGYINKRALPLVGSVRHLISGRVAREFLRYAKRYAHIRRNLSSLTILCNSPEFWALRLFDVCQVFGVSPPLIEVLPAQI